MLVIIRCTSRFDSDQRVGSPPYLSLLQNGRFIVTRFDEDADLRYEVHRYYYAASVAFHAIYDIGLACKMAVFLN